MTRSFARTTLPAALCLALAFVASGALASGGVRYLSLRHAVRKATFVLVVKRATPAEEKATAHLPYDQGGAAQVAQLETHFRRFEVAEVLRADARGRGSVSVESYLHPGKERTVDLAKAATVGASIRVLSSQTVANQMVEVRVRQGAARTTPPLRRLELRLDAERLRTDERFVLLARYNPRYEAFVGVGGTGLLAAEHLEQVRRLLAGGSRLDP